MRWLIRLVLEGTFAFSVAGVPADGAAVHLLLASRFITTHGEVLLLPADVKERCGWMDVEGERKGERVVW